MLMVIYFLVINSKRCITDAVAALKESEKNGFFNSLRIPKSLKQFIR